MSILTTICMFMRGIICDRARLALENLALRQQLAVLKHTHPRPSLHGSLDVSAPES